MISMSNAWQFWVTNKTVLRELRSATTPPTRLNASIGKLAIKLTKPNKNGDPVSASTSQF